MLKLLERLNQARAGDYVDVRIEAASSEVLKEQLLIFIH